ncbi:MAG: TRAP transporter large permease subunit [Rhodospirillales bacterium]|nr:TRAP transporter large permease subunit [Rhodospirillales bacterium]
MELPQILNLMMFGTALILLLSGFPVAFTLAGSALAYAGLGIYLDVFDPTFLRAFPQRIFGTMTNEVLIAVPLFIFMGVMLQRSKVAEELLEGMSSLFGTLRGGLGISVTLVGALLAASTGIVGATVVTMGLLSLPTMLRRGYSPSLAAGSIAAAGTLGQVIPPSIVLVLLGDTLSSAYQKSQLEQGIFSPETVSVGDLFAGALLPGLMLVGLYILYQFAMAIIRPDTSPPAATHGADYTPITFAGLMRILLPPVTLIISVLGSILTGMATPTEAAAVGAVGATLLAGLKLRPDEPQPIYVAAGSLVVLLALAAFTDLRIARESISFVDGAAIGLALILCLGLAWGVIVSLARTYWDRVLTEVMRSTTETTSMVFVILIGASLFSLVFRGLEGEEMVHGFLSSIPGGTLGAMIVVMAVMFFLGFFLDFLEIIFVVVPMVAPVLITMGVDPVWLGVMMAVNLQTSFLTPPFGFALFYLRGVAPESVTTAHIYWGVVPFVIIQLFALGLLALYPQIATWLPNLVYG